MIIETDIFIYSILPILIILLCVILFSIKCIKLGFINCICIRRYIFGNNIDDIIIENQNNNISIVYISTNQRQFKKKSEFQYENIDNKIDIENNESIEENNLTNCFICFERIQEIILLDCCHSGLCHFCLKKLLLSRIYNCPLCRKQIKGCEKIIKKINYENNEIVQTTPVEIITL